MAPHSQIIMASEAMGTAPAGQQGRLVFKDNGVDRNGVSIRKLVASQPQDRRYLPLFGVYVRRDADRVVIMKLDAHCPDGSVIKNS